MPPRNRDNKRVIAYLESRGVAKPLILDAIKRGSLYETAVYHNACFIGRDEHGKARFAALRGTMGNFKRDADGSDKRFGFCLPPTAPECKTLIVFESPVDALSHQSLYPDTDGFRLSLGGTALAALMCFLETHKEIENVIVATDNDAAGKQAAAKIAELPNIKVSRSLPERGKDWNEFLQLKQSEVNNMEDVRKDIRFINSDYRTLFTIKDGENIRFTSGFDGTESVKKCRWIDEMHTQIGSETYHNCQWAEICERNNHTFYPAVKPENKIDILSAKYGEDLKPDAIPMIESAVRRLVGGKYEVTPLKYQSGHVFGALLSGKDGIIVCGMSNGKLTSLHPYNVQSQKRELSPAMPPQSVQMLKPKMQSLLGELESAQKEAADINAAKTTGEKSRKQAERD